MRCRFDEYFRVYGKGFRLEGHCGLYAVDHDWGNYPLEAVRGALRALGKQRVTELHAALSKFCRDINTAFDTDCDDDDDGEWPSLPEPWRAIVEQIEAVGIAEAEKCDDDGDFPRMTLTAG